MGGCCSSNSRSLPVEVSASREPVTTASTMDEHSITKDSSTAPAVTSAKEASTPAVTRAKLGFFFLSPTPKRAPGHVDNIFHWNNKNGKTPMQLRNLLPSWSFMSPESTRAVKYDEDERA